MKATQMPPSTDEWINKMGYTYTIDTCYNMDELKHTVLSERSKTQRPHIV